MSEGIVVEGKLKPAWSLMTIPRVWSVLQNLQGGLTAQTVPDGGQRVVIGLALSDEAS